MLLILPLDTYVTSKKYIKKYPQFLEKNYFATKKKSFLWVIILAL